MKVVVRKVNKNMYETEVRNGFLSKRRHPEFEDLVILNYTDECVYEKHWNDITLACRGLILNERTGDVLARPFSKFFNFGEDAGILLEKPKGEPTISIKLDGSLGISYIWNDKLYWSTRGSFESLQAGVANRIWKAKYSHVDIEKVRGITLLTEIIDAGTRVVVDYEGLSELVLIGAIRIEDGYDYSHEELVLLASDLGMAVNERTNLTTQQALELKTEIGYNEEGWVLRWPNGFRLKIKGDKYMDIHRLLYGLSIKKKVEVWAKGDIQELVKKLPEEFRKEVEDFETKLNLIEKGIKDSVNEFYQSCLKLDFKSRKEFALYARDNGVKKYLSFYFNLLDGREPDYREYILKNYRDLLGGEE